MRIKLAASQLIIVLAVFALVLSGCGGSHAPTSAPTRAPAATATTAPILPTVTTVPVVATATTAPSAVPSATAVSTVAPTETPQAADTATPTAAQSGYDGNWEGQSSSDSPISFQIENNQITSISLNYADQAASCFLSGSYSRGVDNAPINAKTFTVKLTDSDGIQYTLMGTFSSNTDASGTLEVKGTSSPCGAIDAKSTWSAKFTPQDTVDNTTPEPTDAVPTDTVDTSDPIEVLTGFFDQVNSSDLDAALALVDDNVTFNIGSTAGIGKEQLKAYFQKQVDADVSYAVSDIDETGGVIKFVLHTDGIASASGADSAIIQDGKIMVLKLQ